MRPRLLLAEALLPAVVALSAPAQDKSAELDAAVQKRSLAEAVRLFSEIAQPTPKDQYLVGHVLIDLHRPADARPRLVAAREAGFVDWPGWPTIDALVARADTVEKLAPPLRPAAQPDAALTTYAGAPTRWTAPVLDALPEFVAVGRSIFGNDVPALRIYVFAERPVYDRFYRALFGVDIPTVWQDGTGNFNVVTCCAVDREGKETRAAGLPETVSCVLHEFGHAWFGTYLMDRYGREWNGPATSRPWLDEGLSDYVATLREPAFLERRREWLKAKKAAGVPAPSLDEMKHYEGFYESGDVDSHYWVAALLVAELLGPRDKAPAVIRRVLDELGRTGDIDATVRAATGKDVKKEFDALVRRYW